MLLNVGVGVDLCPYESAGQVGVDGAGGIYRGLPLLQRPGPHLVGPDREEADEAERVVDRCEESGAGEFRHETPAAVPSHYKKNEPPVRRLK